MNLAEIQDQLRSAHRALALIRDQHAAGIPADTAFALGEALGMIRHAEALVARDLVAQTVEQTPRHG